MPIAWEELTHQFDPATWTIRKTLTRLKGRFDPWAGYFGAQQGLPHTS